MSTRTQELFDFAHMEPTAIDDFEEMLRMCDQEETEHVEQVVGNLQEALEMVARERQEEG